MELDKNLRENDPAGPPPITIVFLCSGNIIRSAYADLVFAKMAYEETCLRDRIQVHSGAVTYYNQRIFSGIVPFLQQEGVDPSRIAEFRPRHIDDYPELLSEADLILVMTQTHLDRIPDEYRDKAHLVYQYGVGEALEIPDPYFDPPLERAVNLLKKALMGLLERLKSELCP